MNITKNYTAHWNKCELKLENQQLNQFLKQSTESKD